jgi:hypothetical protein
MEVNFDAVNKYKIYTKTEFDSAIKLYHSDFSDLFYYISSNKNDDKLRSLLSIKYEYEIRYLEQGDYGKYSHLHKKLMTFIDTHIFTSILEIKNIKRTKSSVLAFHDLFKDRRIANKVVVSLLESGYIKRSKQTEFEWRTIGRNAGKEIEALLKILIDKKLIKEDYEKDYEQISLAVANSFNVKRSPKTFNRTKFTLFDETFSELKRIFKY